MTLRSRLAALLALMLVGAVLTTGFVAVQRMENALVDEVDALVFFRLSGPTQPILPDGLPTPGPAPLTGAEGGPSLTTDNNPFGDPDGRNVAEFVLDAETGAVVSELLAGFDDDPLPAPDLAQVPEGTLAAPVTISSIDGAMRYRVLTRIDTADPTRIRVVAGSLAAADDTIDDLQRAVAFAGLLAAALGATIGWFVIRRETRPLGEVLQAAEGFAAGDLSRRAAVARPGSEVGRLGVGLNAVLDQVESSVRAEQAASERLSAFVDDVAHELRTPATTIAGWAELYQNGALKADADVDRMVERIRGETARLASLVEEMVLLARHDTVRDNLLGEVDLVDVVAAVVDDANALDGSRVIEVHAPATALVTGDRTRLEQVIGNVLDNARVHTPAGTPIDIFVRPSGTMTEVVVADDGPGIPAELVERVFDRSFRAATGGTRGRGLGLAIVKTIVEDHGGSVAITSAEGQGMTVTITLPSA